MDSRCKDCKMIQGDNITTQNMLVVLNIMEDGEEEVLDQETCRLVVGFEKGRSKMYLKINDQGRQVEF